MAVGFKMESEVIGGEDVVVNIDKIHKRKYEKGRWSPCFLKYSKRREEVFFFSCSAFTSVPIFKKLFRRLHIS